MSGSKPGERRGGRQKGTPNRVTAEIKAAFQKHGDELVEALLALTKDKDPRVRLGAIQAALDRGWGRPAQAVQVGADSDTALVVHVMRFGDSLTEDSVTPQAQIGA